jgi:hypothetical protein
MRGLINPASLASHSCEHRAGVRVLR